MWGIVVDPHTRIRERDRHACLHDSPTPHRRVTKSRAYDRPAVDDLDDVFAQLRPLLTKHAESLVVICDEPGDLQLETKRSGPSGTRMAFGALKTRPTT